jgi:hypothetical protein
MSMLASAMQFAPVGHANVIGWLATIAPAGPRSFVNKSAISTVHVVCVSLTSITEPEVVRSANVLGTDEPGGGTTNVARK